MDAESNKQLRILNFVLMLTGAASLGLVIPTISFYVQSMGGNAETMSYISMACTVMSIISIPIWGRLSDLFGRKIVAQACTAGIALSMFALARSETIFTLTLSRMVTAIFAGMIIAANGSVADLTHGNPNLLSKRFGRSEGSYTLGILVFGAFLGAILVKINYQVCYYAGFVAKNTSAHHKGLAISLVKVTLPAALFTGPLWAILYGRVGHFLPFYCSLGLTLASIATILVWPWKLERTTP